VTVDRRYQQIAPTHVALTKSELDPKTRLELIRLLQSEQGLPCAISARPQGVDAGSQRQVGAGGETYLNLVTSQGMSAKPGIAWCLPISSSIARGSFSI